MLPRNALTLKQFIKRTEVLKAYKDLLRAINNIEDKSDRSYMKKWARDEFQSKKNIPNTDEESINYHLQLAQKWLKQLTVSQNMSK